MARSAIIYRRNRLLGDLVTISPSSEQPSFTREALQRASVRDPLRFQPGWDVVAGVNDKINFSVAGVDKTATLTAGSYPSVNAWALHVKARMEAADAHTYTVSQAATGLWTISTSVTFVIKGSTGANKTQSALPDLGFGDVDTSAATSQTGTSVAFMSRKFVALDIGLTPENLTWSVDSTNDAIDVERNGVAFSGFLTHGVYTSGAAMALAGQNALAAANPAGVWLVVWDPATGFSFAMTGGGTNARLLTGTGANLSRAAWAGFGFNVGSDSLLNNVFVSDFVPQGTPVYPDVVFLRGNNISPAATVTLQGDATALDAQPLRAVVDYSQVLTPDSRLRTDMFRLDIAGGTKLRYFRLVIDARDSGASTDVRQYVELSVLFMGTAFELPGVEPTLSDTRHSLSSGTITPGGQHTVVQRTSRRGYRITIHLIDDDGRDDIEAVLDEVGVGGMFFFDLDPDYDPYATRYMFFLDEADFEKVEERNAADRLWTMALELFEAVR